MIKMFRAAATALLLSTPLAAQADTPVNGIGGLAISPDGATVLAAADSRVIYVMDGATMQVTNRVYTGTTTVWMDYRIDGKVVFMRDTDGTLQARDAATFDVLWKMDRTETAAYAFAANQLAVTVREDRKYVAKLIDATTFETKATYELGEKFYPSAQGISLDGLRMVVMSRSEKRPGEEKKRPESGMKGIERSLFQQQHDQRGARIAQIDLILGNVSVTESWYKSDNVRGMVVTPTDTFVLSFSQEMSRISAAGDVEIIDSGARNHYGATMTTAADRIVSGSLKQITVKPLDSDAAQVFKLDDLPGWPEYVIRFETTQDGKILAATTAYRVIVLDPAAGSVQAHPVH